MTSGIYKIEHIASGKVYVGSAIKLNIRFSSHRSALRLSTHPNIKLQRAWNRYGDASFTFSVLEYVDDVTELIGYEQYWIDRLCAAEHGYNVAPTAGSSLGRITSPETRVKQSMALKGRPIHPNRLAALIGRVYSLETRAKISSALSKPRPKHTPEQRAARAAWQTGKRHTAESRAKMSSAQKRRPPCSDETRAKLSAAGTGRIFSPETRTKISMAHLRRRQRAFQA